MRPSLSLAALLFAGSCATSSTPKVLRETKQLAPRTYERPQDLANPFLVTHSVEDVCSPVMKATLPRAR